MPDTFAPIDVVRRLSRAILTLRMYGADHPQGRADLEFAMTALSRTLETAKKFSFVLHMNALAVAEVPQPMKDPAVVNIYDSMRLRFVSSVTFLPGLEMRELIKVATVLAAKPAEVTEGNALKMSLVAGLERVRVNDIRMREVEEGDAVIPTASVVPETFDRRKIADTISALARDPDAARRAIREIVEGSAGANQAAIQDSVFARIESMAGQGKLGGARDLLVEFLAGTPGGGPAPTGEVIQRNVERLPSSMKEIFPEEVLIREMAVTVLARQLQAVGASPEARRLFQHLAPGPAEAVGLIDAVGAGLRKTGYPGDEKDLQKAMRLPPWGDRLEDQMHGCVLVVDGNAERREAYRKALADFGFVVETAETGKEGADKALEFRRYNALVTDMVLPDKGGGGAILSRLLREKLVIPVVIATAKAASYAYDVEIMSYARKRFVPSHEPYVIANAARRIALKVERPAGSASESDRKATRATLDALPPREVRQIPGWTIAHESRATGVAPPAWVDVFPVDRDRLGIVVAEGSAKGLSGACAAAVVRSAFRVAAPETPMPKDTVARANRLLRADFRKGLYAPLVYASLHVPSNTLTVVNCGFTPPMVFHPQAGPPTSLQLTGLPLGLPAPAAFEAALVEQQVKIEADEHVLFVSESLVRATDAKDQEFGDDRAREAFFRNAHFGPDKLIAAVRDAAAAHAGAPPESYAILDLARIP